jgi:ATP-dependent RNA helicase DeaD
MKMPTRADLAAKRVEVFKESVRKTIAEGDLDLYMELVEQLVEEGPFDIAEIAAAAARIANASRTLVVPKEEEAPTPAPHAERNAAERTGGPPLTDKTITLSMSVGRREGIRPADVVGSIANEANVPGRDIGPIEIRDEITYVGIPERYVETVLAKVGKKRFRGRALNLRVATKAPPPREDKPRPPYGAKPYGAKPHGAKRPAFSKAPPKGHGRKSGSR